MSSDSLSGFEKLMSSDSLSISESLLIILIFSTLLLPVLELSVLELSVLLIGSVFSKESISFKFKSEPPNLLYSDKYLLINYLPLSEFMLINLLEIGCFNE